MKRFEFKEEDMTTEGIETIMEYFGEFIQCFADPDGDNDFLLTAREAFNKIWSIEDRAMTDKRLVGTIREWVYLMVCLIKRQLRIDVAEFIGNFSRIEDIIYEETDYFPY